MKGCVYENIPHLQTNLHNSIESTACHYSILYIKQKIYNGDKSYIVPVYGIIKKSLFLSQ